MLSELLENEVLSVAFYGKETDWNSGCVCVCLCVFSNSCETYNTHLLYVSGKVCTWQTTE